MAEPLANILGRVDATGALLVAISGSIPAASFPLLAPDGSVAAPSYSWAVTPGSGFYHTGAGATSTLRLALNSLLVALWDPGGVFQLRMDSCQIQLGAASDIVLLRGAANRLDLASGDSFYVISGAIGVNNVPGVAGSVTATSFIGSGAALTGIAGATGGVSNTVNTNIIADSDNNGSGLIDFMTGIVSKWNITNAGHLAAMLSTVQLQASDGTAGAPSISFTSDPDTGFYRAGAAQINIAHDGSISGIFSATNWSSPVSLFIGTAQDVQLSREAADVLALRRTGANPQTFRLYNTFTDGANYERLNFTWSGNTAQILTAQIGTGTARNISIGTTGSAVMTMVTNNTGRWQFDANGHLIAFADNTYDIGQSGATRPRSIYVVDKVETSSGGTLGFAGRGAIAAITGDGIFRLANAAVTDFNRLQFGGTTSAFPALKRSGTTLAARLADDSADAPFTASTIVASSNIDSGGRFLAPTSGYFGWNGSSIIRSSADGVIRLLNNLETDFTRLTFGPATASFPALRRNSSSLEVVLADGSANAGLTASALVATASITSQTGIVVMATGTIRTGLGTPEGAITAAVGSLFMRLDGGAGTSFYVKETGAGNTGWVAK